MKSPSTENPRFLQGMRLLITRPEERAKTLVDAIISAGGVPILVPTVDIVDPYDMRPLLDIFNHRNTFDIAIFVSPNAVNKLLEHWQLFRAKFHRDNLKLTPLFLDHLQVIAIGPGTKERLSHYSIIVDDMPAQHFSTEGLLALPALQKVSAKCIVIFCGEGGRTELAETLGRRGAQVTLAYTYRRHCAGQDLQEQLQDWQKQGIDLVVGTSGESLYNLIQMLGVPGSDWLRRLPCLVVSQRMADLTKMLGFVIPPIIADNATNEGIFKALIRATTLSS